MTQTDPITADEVQAAQAAWGNGVVHVGAAGTWDEAHTRATALIQQLYQCDGSLLFCPTMARIAQFRRTAEETLSYFVGGSSVRPEDHGFALAPWTSVRFENVDIVSQGVMATAMGDYFFQRPDGTEFQAQFSFVYTRDSTGSVRIQLHHSSLPYGA